MARAPLITLYSEFRSWDEFFKTVKEHCDATSQPLVKGTTKSVVCINSRLKNSKNLYPEEMVYAHYSFVCSHRGIYKPRGNGLRKTTSQKGGCPAKIFAHLDRYDRHKIKISQLIETHNHEISPELYKGYVQTRRLSTNEKIQAMKLAQLKLSNTKLREEVCKMTGKMVTRDDICNLKKWIQKEAPKLSSKFMGHEPQDGESNNSSLPDHAYVEEDDLAADIMTSSDGFATARATCDAILQRMVYMSNGEVWHYVNLLQKFERFFAQGGPFDVVPYEGSGAAAPHEVQVSSSGLAQLCKIEPPSSLESIHGQTESSAGVEAMDNNEESHAAGEGKGANSLLSSGPAPPRHKSHTASLTVGGLSDGLPTKAAASAQQQQQHANNKSARHNHHAQCQRSVGGGNNITLSLNDVGTNLPLVITISEGHKDSIDQAINTISVL